jgi:hypothetical protein
LSVDVKRDTVSFIPPSSGLVENVRETSAKEIAKGLVNVFRLSLLGVLAGGFVLLGISATGIFFRVDMSPMSALMKDTAIPFLQAAGTFATTVFGPLLAFVLGYYFGEKNKSKN